MPAYQRIELCSFKYPRRPTTAPLMIRVIGEDRYGLWLGVRQGEPWRSADGTRSGVFEQSLVKLVPPGTFWTVCFQTIEPVIDVDIVLPVRRVGEVLEEVDLELDVLRLGDGTVQVRDEDKFDSVRQEWGMPDDIAHEAIAACDQIRERLENNTEPFATVGQAWLNRFVTDANLPEGDFPT